MSPFEGLLAMIKFFDLIDFKQIFGSSQEFVGEKGSMTSN